MPYEPNPARGQPTPELGSHGLQGPAHLPFKVPDVKLAKDQHGSTGRTVKPTKTRHVKGDSGPATDEGQTQDQSQVAGPGTSGVDSVT